ncbi:uncharacterized protein LOC128863111 [Anastrepha ludens]|uniref:uncharacterized protein LOC128863111 n=1 Tax=Anastrepha ludens TaxID=28586 RepID=UPI0023B0A09D|nr:uncharacterized protein LOC128863111 [Anastrepha ludens]
MCGQYKVFILFLCALSSAAMDANLRNCSNSSISNTLVEACPANSQCELFNNTFKCICLPNFQHNVIPASLPNLEHAFLPYCQFKNVSDTVDGESKVMLYIRSPVKTELLVCAILMILLAVIAVLAIIYVIKLLKPLKRTKIAYVKLKRRGNKHQRLVEEEVYDGIAMTRRNEDAQYEFY